MNTQKSTPRLGALGHLMLSLSLRITGLVLLVACFTAPAQAAFPRNHAKIRPTQALEKAPQTAQRLFLPLVVENSPFPVEIPPTTKTLTPASLQYLTAFSESHLAFSQPTPELEGIAPGDVIASPVSGLAPYGFLLKVTNVIHTNRSVIFLIERATLREAITTGMLRFTTPLLPSEIQSTNLPEGITLEARKQPDGAPSFVYTLHEVVFDQDGNPATTSDQVIANGQISMDATINFEMVMRDGEMKTLHFDLDTQTTNRLSLASEFEGSVSIEKTIAEIVFAPLTIWIGPVPVVLNPAMTIGIGLQGNIRIGISPEVVQTATLSGAITFRDDQWSHESQYSNQFDYTLPPEITGNLNITGTVDTELVVLFYGMVGPEAGIRTYLNWIMDEINPPDGALYGGLALIVGFEANIAGYGQLEFHVTVAGVRQLITLIPPNPASPPHAPALLHRKGNVTRRCSHL